MQVEVPDDAVPQVEQSPMAASAYSQLDEESLANDREEQLHESIQYPWYWRCFHFTDSTAIVLDTDGPKPRRPRSQMNVLDHPVVVSLILQFPWIGLSLLYFSVFELMTSYLTSIGVHYFVPRYMPAFLTFALAPLVGAASDRCSSKTGRRNRFLLLATLKLVVSVMLLGGSLSIFGSHLFLLTVNIAVIVWGTVSMEVAVRARIFDEIPKEYQVHAHACGSIWHSVGVALGMVLVGGGAKVVYGDQITEEVMLLTCGVAVAAILVTVGVSLYLKPEKMLYQERKHSVSLERFVTEIWDVIVGAPMEIKLMCLLQLIVWYTVCIISSQWLMGAVGWHGSRWTIKSTSGGRNACFGGVHSFKAMPQHPTALSSQAAMLPASSFTWKVWTWRAMLCKAWWVPCTRSWTLLFTFHAVGRRVRFDSHVLLVDSEKSDGGASQASQLDVHDNGRCDPSWRSSIHLTDLWTVFMLLLAVIVGSWSHLISFVAFVSLGGFFTTVYILPFAMTGVIAKDFMDATDRFNNNGLYVGLLMQFSCCAKFAVENYNTTAISSLGSDDVLALPLLLFVASTVFTFFYKYDV
ncbi:hypothetical protein, variant 1 [Aphanomyces invadans]|uniref:Uncharacterized protein n=1 Tax=Aphanomyces invadans TaxID=157072 RepID=A0A024UQR2_9STRA|nr:hypothetical protein, variant 1 [Aphanomyces invadans]ETW07938.1 hypothetical protein, variant 1 [Aphanomyces invadans]|eukprot:XP_008864040.1 hypothetical protein, variant 1 [Aphanomyces invadans]